VGKDERTNPGQIQNYTSGRYADTAGMKYGKGTDKMLKALPFQIN